MDILTVLFLVLCMICIPLGEIIRIPFGANATFLPIDGVVMLIGILGFMSLFKEKKYPQVLKEILFFISVALLSLLFNIHTVSLNQFITAGLYLIRWVSYAGVYIAVIQLKPKSARLLPWFMLTSVGILAFLGIVQFFLYPNLRNLAYLGWDVHLYRLFSTFLDPNFMGVFLGLGFLFGLGVLIQQHLSAWKKVGLVSFLVGVLICVYLTYSRSAYLMVGSGALLMLLLSTHRKKLLYVGTGIVMLLLISILFIKPKSEGTNLLRTSSSSARIVTTQTALSIFLNSPIYGVGFNMYRYAQVRYGYLTQKDIEESHAAAGTDNSFMFVLATTGIVGLLGYLFLYGKITLLAIKNRENVYTLTWIGSIIGASISAFFINSLFYPFIVVWLWMLAGLIESR